MGTTRGVGLGLEVEEGWRVVREGAEEGGGAGCGLFVRVAVRIGFEFRSMSLVFWRVGSKEREGCNAWG